MGERNSEYQRIEADTYVTPQWVFDALFQRETIPQPWDCAPVNADFDFLTLKDLPEGKRSIVTNPPYKLADEFIWHALELTRPRAGMVALLLPHAFDTGKRRRGMWRTPFKIKWVLTTRIRWTNIVQKKHGPSTNHAWYVWDHYSYPMVPMVGWV
jgi:hypothetical protein